MFQRIGARGVLDAVDQWHLPVGTAVAADDAAERAPFAEIARHDIDAEGAGRAAALVKMVAVSRRAAGQRGREGRRASLEIAARAEHAVRINDDAGIAHREMLAAHRRQDRLVIDAGVGHQHAEGLQRGDRAGFERRHRVGLAEPLVGLKIEAARVG